MASEGSLLLDSPLHALAAALVEGARWIAGVSACRDLHPCFGELRAVPKRSMSRRCAFVALVVVLLTTPAALSRLALGLAVTRSWSSPRRPRRRIWATTIAAASFAVLMGLW